MAVWFVTIFFLPPQRAHVFIQKNTIHKKKVIHDDAKHNCTALFIVLVSRFPYPTTLVKFDNHLSPAPKQFCQCPFIAWQTWANQSCWWPRANPFWLFAFGALVRGWRFFSTLLDLRSQAVKNSLQLSISFENCSNGPSKNLSKKKESIAYYLFSKHKSNTWSTSELIPAKRTAPNSFP